MPFLVVLFFALDNSSHFLKHEPKIRRLSFNQPFELLKKIQEKEPASKKYTMMDISFDHSAA